MHEEESSSGSTPYRNALRRGHNREEAVILLIVKDVSRTVAIIAGLRDNTSIPITRPCVLHHIEKAETAVCM